ncbi:MAG: hypothetical protein AAF152_14490 [Cyanobacteria bacterium P01_A01_bin.114]
MTQPSPSTQLTAVSTASPSPESSQLVESYAEDLMDELFDDVDRILEGDLPLNSSVASPFTAADTPFGSNPVDLPAMIVPVTAVEATEAEQPVDAKDKPSPKRWYRKRIPQIALGAACVSAILAFGFWLAKENATQPKSVVQVETAPETAPLSAEDAFLEYLGRSMNIIQGQTSAQVSATQPGTVLPANSVNRNVQSAGASGTNVIERVFVPVFQPSQQTTVTSLPTLPSLSGQPSPSSATPLPSLSPQAAAPSNPTIPNIAPVNTHVLVGVLELGERSAALFEINGVAQRVYVGENVGASGWSVVSIANEEIVVRRNGEVRSIYIGQQF